MVFMKFIDFERLRQQIDTCMRFIKTNNCFVRAIKNRVKLLLVLPSATRRALAQLYIYDEAGL